MKTRIDITTGHVAEQTKEFAITPYIFAQYTNCVYTYDKSFMIGISWGYRSFYINFNIYK